MEILSKDTKDMLALAGLSEAQYYEAFLPCEDCRQCSSSALVVWDEKNQLQEIQFYCDEKGWIKTKDQADCPSFVLENKPS